MPEGLDARTAVLKQPLKSVYLVATSAMCLLDTLGALPAVGFAGIQASGWHIPAARQAMEAGHIRYAGKYSAPDYELLVAEGCGLAIESTMILQAPEVPEKLRELGIPMFIDLSGLEESPLGRTEWMKVYGALFGKEQEALAAYDAQKAALAGVIISEGKQPAVAYFYMNSSGAVVSKTERDYIPGLIRLAGGDYLGPALKTSETASVTMDMEAFYALAREADVLMYNGAIDDPPQSLDALMQLNELFADFKAVKEGRVFSVSGALYQSSHRFGEVVRELHQVLTGNNRQTSPVFFTQIP